MAEIILEGLKTLCEKDADAAFALEGRLEAAAALLERFIDEIELFNGAYGLVSCKTREELAVRHVLDSAAPLGLIIRELKRRFGERGHYRVADIGSGAGFPGLPLAVADGRLELTLVERSRRRARFLFNTIAVLGIKNACAVNRDFTELDGRSFDAFTFRALCPLNSPEFLKIASILPPGAFIAAYKGRGTEDFAPSFDVNVRVQEYKAPFSDGERRLVILPA